MKKIYNTQAIRQELARSVDKTKQCERRLIRAQQSNNADELLSAQYGFEHAFENQLEVIEALTYAIDYNEHDGYPSCRQ